MSECSSYQRAVVLLAGVSGVGKSGLAGFLSEGCFTPTDSTHGQVQHCIFLQDAGILREICLVDVAGQPHYRLVHQMYIQPTSVVLILFNPVDETDPLMGLHAWSRFFSWVGLKTVSLQLPKKVFLVAARVDQKGARVSRSRIDKAMSELGFHGYFETSAKEGWGIEELRSALVSSIDWNALSLVTVKSEFWRLKNVCTLQRECGIVFLGEDELFALSTLSTREAFATCLDVLDRLGVVRKLPLEQGVLLWPEKLSAYASGLTMWVTENTNGTGLVAAERILEGDFSIPSGERIKDRRQEIVVLRTMLKDLLDHDVALYEQNGVSPLVIFPSLAYQNCGLGGLAHYATAKFRGSVRELYAALAVCLARSNIFCMECFGQSEDGLVALYHETNGVCGILLRIKSEDFAEVQIFFSDGVLQEKRQLFEEYITSVLMRGAEPTSVQLERILRCGECGTIITQLTIRIRRERGFDFVRCSVCDGKLSLPGDLLSPGYEERVAMMDHAVNLRKEWEMSRFSS